MPRRQELPDGMTKRGRTYHASFRHRGQRIRKSLSRDLGVARQLLVELRARIQKGDYSLLDNEYPVEDLKQQYLAHCEQTLKPGSVRAYRFRLQAILPHLPRRVFKIDTNTIIAYRHKRLAEGKSPATINLEVMALGTMLNWGVNPGRLIGKNPIKNLKPLPHDHPKEGRALTDEEVDRLLAFSPPHYRDIWYCFLVTGMRREEVVQLRFDDIDWENRELVVRRGVAKNHNARRLPIDDELWTILKQKQAGRRSRKPVADRGTLGERFRSRFTRDHVFTTRKNTPLDNRMLLYATFIRHCGKAGIETRRMNSDGHEVDHVDLHSLRRTFATHLVVNGADPKTVQELLGHKTLAMTMNLYTKIHAGTKRQALSSLPWGRGVQTPEHLVTLPKRDLAGHKMATSPETPDVTPLAANG